VKLAAAGALLASSVPLRKAWAQSSATRASPLGNLPSLDGELVFDDTSRQAAAVDNGGYVRRAPIAVLKPRSVNDIARILSYANKHGLKVAMRGQGHSHSGQALVEGGIVIDSSTLNAVRLVGNDALDAQPGALWGDVAKASLAQGLTPPVMVDAMMLTVGGTLSVGGTGETSYRFGAQVDHVLELDVVTGAGELVTCSPERNDELFRMVLAGLGQCGIIVRARLRLIQAPKYVAMRTMIYDDMDAFLSDQARLMAVDALGPLNGRAMREKDGQPRFALVAGSFVAEADDGNRPPAWMSGLRFKSEASTTAGPYGVSTAAVPYADYLSRRTAGATANAEAVKRGTTNPSLVLTLPDNSVRPFLSHILSAPETFVGIWLLEVSPKITARHTQPLQKMPAGALSFELRMQRRASSATSPEHKAILAANQELLPRLLAAGGKIYPPFAPILSKEQWQQHYGAETWQRFAAAKKRFDPNNVLTPGAGIF
jgi:FAD/FMN-containing dehydrogenase